MRAPIGNGGRTGMVKSTKSAPTVLLLVGGAAPLPPGAPVPSPRLLAAASGGGAALMLAEAHVPSHGLLATASVAALTAGVVLALSGAGAAGGAVIAAGVGVALAGIALAWLLVVKSLAARRLAVRSGPQALTG